MAWNNKEYTWWLQLRNRLYQQVKTLFKVWTEYFASMPSVPVGSKTEEKNVVLGCVLQSKDTRVFCGKVSNREKQIFALIFQKWKLEQVKWFPDWKSKTGRCWRANGSVACRYGENIYWTCSFWSGQRTWSGFVNVWKRREKFCTGSNRRKGQYQKKDVGTEEGI